MKRKKAQVYTKTLYLSSPNISYHVDEDITDKELINFIKNQWPDYDYNFAQVKLHNQLKNFFGNREIKNIIINRFISYSFFNFSLIKEGL